MKYVNLLKKYGRVILVFDGKPLQSKFDTNKKRRARREKNREIALRLLKEGKFSVAKPFCEQALDISPEMVHNVIRTARRHNIDCIVAPFEADAQLAYLAKSGICNFVVSEDGDLAVYGCQRILFKLTETGYCSLYEKEHLNKVFGTQMHLESFDNFRYMCISAGCDYLTNLPGIGIKKAKNFWMKVTNPDLRTVLSKIPASLKMPQVSITQDYIERFIRANNTFLYQLVFDPVTRKEKPLTPYPADLREELETLTYAGTYSPPEIAAQMAVGNLNTKLEKVDDFDPSQVIDNRSIWRIGFREEGPIISEGSEKTHKKVKLSDITWDSNQKDEKAMKVKNRFPQQTKRKLSDLNWLGGVQSNCGLAKVDKTETEEEIHQLKEKVLSLQLKNVKLNEMYEEVMSRLIIKDNRIMELEKQVSVMQNVKVNPGVRKDSATKLEDGNGMVSSQNSQNCDLDE